MSAQRRALLAALTVLLISGGGAAMAARAGGASERGIVSSTAPPLRGSDLHGRPFDTAELRGHVLLVTVWASWCAPCRAELPLLAAAAQQWGGRGLRVVGVDFRDRDGPALRLLRADGATGIRSVRDPDGRLAVAWGVFGVPETFLVDPGGVVRARRAGPVDDVWLHNRVEPLLAGQGLSP